MILRKVGNVAYELKLPSRLSFIHPVFHVSMLRKYVGDPSTIVPLEGFSISDSLSYEEFHIDILERQVRRLYTKIWLQLRFYGKITRWKKLLGKLKRT